MSVVVVGKELSDFSGIGISSDLTLLVLKFGLSAFFA